MYSNKTNNGSNNGSNSELNSDLNNPLNINISEYKSVKNKFNIQMCKKDDNYFIHFTISNTKYNLNQLIETSIIDMLKNFNADLIEDFILEKTITNENTENGNMLLLLHSPRKDMGISKKFIKSTYSIQTNDNVKRFSCCSDPYSNEDSLQIENKSYNKITLKSFDALIDTTNVNSAVFSMHFNIDIHEDLPIYMLNMRALIIANICNNLKTFIENM
jgi:hypothetical protein